MLKRLASILLCVPFLAACASTSSSPSSSPSQPPASPSVTADPTVSPDPSEPPPPTNAPSATPARSPGPSPLPATLPVSGSARQAGLGVLLAPGSEGMLYISIPDPGGAVIAILDSGGRPRPGWPIAVPYSTACSFLGAADDGSVRAICDGTDIQQPELCCDSARAFAFDRDGRLMPGWPVEIYAGSTARVVGGDLVLLSDMPTTDVIAFGEVTETAWVSRISADGVVMEGREVPIVSRGGYDVWEIGPDGIGYGVEYIDKTDRGGEVPYTSELTAIDLGGVVDGWPVPLDGTASPPSFDADGRIIVAEASRSGPVTRVVALSPHGAGTLVASAYLPLESADWGVDCVHGPPDPPLVADDGTIVVHDIKIQSAFYALDASLEVLPGWPWRPTTAIAYVETGVPDGIDCPADVDPALGPTGVLEAALLPVYDRVGGSLVAIGRDGRVVPGWPVELKREGSAFWSVVAGADGTAYALAVEPESSSASSATILAIAPDSTVRWRTTVVEP